MAPVAQQPFDLWQAAAQSPRADVIADLTGGDEQVERPITAIADRMQPGVHPAFGSTDDAPALVPWGRSKNDTPTPAGSQFWSSPPHPCSIHVRSRHPRPAIETPAHVRSNGRFERSEPSGLTGLRLRQGAIIANWPDILRTKATTLTGRMPPGQLLKKPAARPRQNHPGASNTRKRPV